MKPHATALSLAVLSIPLIVTLTSCETTTQRTTQSFLDEYTAEYLRLQAEAAEAHWALNTKIMEGDETNSKRVQMADGALAEFTGSVKNIETATELLAEQDALSELQRRQLDRVLYAAANNPQTIQELVTKRIAAEASQTETLFGFDFKIDGASVSTNDIDRILTAAESEPAVLAAWTASKEVGRSLKDGLVELVSLRNQSVQALGYDNYFQYQVSDYGMTVSEMTEMTERFVRELRPLYRELHTWARYRLAEKYGKPVPKQLPAHWLPNRWGQSWSDMVEVQGFDLDGALKEKGAEWLLRQSERFYVSLGFPPLPESFYERSSLYPLPPNSTYKKNNHASAWHMDLENDVRCLMSVEPNTRWYETTHHELGHIYYYLAYTRPGCPPLLREGANRAFHEAIGSLLGMASMQRNFIQGLGLMPENASIDDTQTLLKEALDSVVFIPFSAGTMTRFEHDLYATDLSGDAYNQRWWEIVRKYQGIEPPSPRGEEYCDAATKTHINNDAAQYYDYALSYVILHQIHAHIAKNILKQDPRNTNYYGNREVGEFLAEILRLGATRDWRWVMHEYLGEDISARAMLEYFAPLQAWLEKQNEGRQATLAEL